MIDDERNRGRDANECTQTQEHEGRKAKWQQLAPTSAHIDNTAEVGSALVPDRLSAVSAQNFPQKSSYRLVLPLATPNPALQEALFYISRCLRELRMPLTSSRPR
jgi:hypothetical protein